MKSIIVFPPFHFFIDIILIFLFYLFFPTFNTIPFPFNLLGIVAVFFGYYIVSKCSNIFNKNKTTFNLETPSVFVQCDYYKYSRNPMYLGLLIIISGLALLTGNLLSFITPVLFFLCINYLCIPPEEAIMQKNFGEEYIKYKQKVKRWL